MLLQDKLWLFHHDSAAAHNALSNRLFLAEKKFAVLEQLPYSPDLAPYGIFVFLKLKGIIKGTRFEGVVAVKILTEKGGKVH